MKVEITYACGHKGVINAYGTGERFEWTKSKAEAELCPECAEKERQEENVRNAERMKAEGAVQLEGTPKQIAWAETVRAELLDGLKELDRDRYGDDYRNAYEYLYQWILQQKSASKIIDCRGKSISSWLLRIQSKAKKNPEMLKEFTRRQEVLDPANKKHQGIVKVSMDDKHIYAEYTKDSAFMKIVKDRGFKWRGGRWVARLTPNSASLIDKAAHLINTLLTEGFSVSSVEPRLLDMAKSGDFTPDEVEYVCKGVFNGKIEFHVYCNTNADLKRYALQLPGAKDIDWEGYVKIPATYAPEIAEMGRIYGVYLSEGVRDMLAPYTHEVVEVEPVTPQGAAGSVSDILESSREVLDDLKD